MNRTLERLIKHLKEHCIDGEIIITPHTILNITKSLYRIKYVIPTLCEKMLNYVNENKTIVSAEIVSRLLYYLYNVGYEPNLEQNQMIDDGTNSKSGLLPRIDAKRSMDSRKSSIVELFDFQNVIQIINRDFDLTPAWLIVQACLALSFYQALPLELINRVFNMDFIVRLEKEMTVNSDKVSRIGEYFIQLKCKFNIFLFFQHLCLFSMVTV